MVLSGIILGIPEVGINYSKKIYTAFSVINYFCCRVEFALPLYMLIFKLSVWKYRKEAGSDEYNLQIKEFVLDDVHIKAEKLHTFEEYEKILNRKENNYNWSLNHYELEYEQSIKINLSDSLWSSSGTMELSVHYSEKPPYRILKHTFSGDTSKWKCMWV